jgi:uncharacterized protein YecT (DUF1311 family)
MRCRFVLILISSVGLGFIGSTLPSHAQSQGEMTGQAYADFAKADAELNAVYKKALHSMADDTARQKLVDAQKAWTKFRDAQAEVDADEARGGSMQPMLRAISEMDTTNARITQLKKSLGDQEGK